MPDSTDSLDQPWTHHRARVAQAVRFGNTEAAEAARADLRVAKLADHIKQVVDAAPPLTDDQRDRLRALLGGGA